eukprot:TRINITY_DN2016_c0_g1_i18.p1 TRINITY_DN2016_c0_g1~~TRINITY_DN2016_c0_g1_i18.p1  ORF type:complete len:195 (+),score=48.97 TRINITY_DN2016_c0_g1_i18:17-601(+)
MEQTRTNTENAKRRIAMKNRRRWKKVIEDIGILRDMLQEVCDRLIRVEQKTQKEEWKNEVYYSCEEESEDGQKDKEIEDLAGRSQMREEQVGPAPLTSSEESTEEISQPEGQDESEEELALSDSELDEEERDLIPNYPFSRKNPGPFAKEFIKEVMKNVIERLKGRRVKLAEKAERQKDPDYFRKTSGLIDIDF